MNEMSEEFRMPLPKSESRDAMIRRLMGKRDFPQRTDEDRLRILKSEDRVRALNAITTTTLPPAKKEMKKGAVLQIAEENLIQEDILKSRQVVYIGSDIDAEYPLSLGARNNTFVDPVFQDARAKTDLIEKLRKLSGEEPKVEGDKISSSFDFGNGKENVTIELVPKFFTPTGKEKRGDDYELPQNIGGIIMYAAQGPGSSVDSDDAMKAKLMDGGFLLEEM